MPGTAAVSPQTEPKNDGSDGPSNDSGDSLAEMTSWTKKMMDNDPARFVNDCVSSNYPREIHSWKTWKFLQDVYAEEMLKFGRKGGGIASWETTQTGMLVPYYIRDDGPRGRSVYTATPLEKGTRVWKSSKLATFEHPEQLVAFLGRLPHHLRCDALLWAYPDSEGEVVALALDEGSYVNHAESEGLLNLDPSCRAKRDIAAGEELLEDYSKFIGVDTLEWFNIIRSVAWEEPKDGSQRGSVPDNDEPLDIQRGYVHLGIPTTAIGNVGASLQSDTKPFSHELGQVGDFVTIEPAFAALLSLPVAFLSATSVLALFFLRKKKVSLGRSPRFKQVKAMV